MNAATKFHAITLGRLAIDKVNQALGTELDPGDVWLSPGAHRHIAVDHPDDYPFIMAVIADVVAQPLYVGQDPKHGRNFYIVRPLPAGAPNPHALVSIGLARDEVGRYRVRTAYTISQDTVTARRSAKRLHVVI